MKQFMEMQKMMKSFGGGKLKRMMQAFKGGVPPGFPGANGDIPDLQQKGRASGNPENGFGEARPLLQQIRNVPIYRFHQATDLRRIRALFWPAGSAFPTRGHR